MARPTPRITRDKNIEFIDAKSGPKVTFFGTRFREVNLPRGSRVIYPNAPMEPLGNVRASVRYALNNPHGCDPLFAQLRPGMKLTIAIDDISMPLPPMVAPDIRQVVLEEVLELCKKYGVDDIHMIIAICLHRRMTGPEIKSMVGRKVYNAYYPDRLYNHDAEDAENIVEIGVTKHGHSVRLNRRAAESDLVIYVNLNLVPMNGGHKSMAVGLCDYKSVSEHHNSHTLKKCHSYMDPTESTNRLATIMNRQGRLVDEKLNVFHIETTINTRMFGGPLSFLNRPERSWSEFDWAKMQASSAALERMPEAMRRKVFQQIKAPYGVIAVEAGMTEPTHEKILEKSFKQYAVPVQGQADVLVMGLSFISPYSVNGILNPILVQLMALGYYFNFYRGNPLVKKDGVIILFHPCNEDFTREHHPSYVEFYHRVLSETRDPDKMAGYEKEFSENPDYIHMYRNGHAYHPVHPFYMWYWANAGRDHVQKVIVVGPENTRVPAQLGFESAPTFEDALEMARTYTGKSVPEVTMFHAPPILVADVTV
jgi:hypothetical protein